MNLKTMIKFKLKTFKNLTLKKLIYIKTITIYIKNNKLYMILITATTVSIKLNFY